MQISDERAKRLATAIVDATDWLMWVAGYKTAEHREGDHIVNLINKLRAEIRLDGTPILKEETE